MLQRDGVTGDRAMSFNYFQLLSERAHCCAQNKLGFCYGHGIGVAHNVDMAAG
jgi:TPR repeat protein